MRTRWAASALLYPGHPNGILNKLGANAAAMGLHGLLPLAPTNTPADSPLRQMFKPSLGPPNSIPANVPVGPACGRSCRRRSLLVQHAGWPADAVRFSFAMPRSPYERYVAPSGHRGFELVRETIPKPFPDAAILRQTTPGAPTGLADRDPGAAARPSPGQHRGGPHRARSDERR